MTYREAVQFFNEIPYFTTDPSNDNLKKILRRVGNPERRLKFFHVAGTNGKGSVCAFLDSILRRGGYKTALFTSPHLVKINERMKVDGKDIADQRFADYLERVQREVKEPLSFFEYLFVMAMLYFVDEQVDYCVLETGLGGTYDSTNVVDPEIAVITSVGLDHTKILGETVEEIAAEKAGIIKKGKPVVFFQQEPSVDEIIEAQAERMESKIIRLSKDDIKIVENHKKGIAFSVESGYHRFNDLSILTKASYQVWNAALALHAVKEVIPACPEAVLQDGIANMYWPARMEEIEPDVILDGAHNPHAIDAWIRNLKEQYPDGAKDLLFAVVADKDYEEMIEMIGQALSFRRVTITAIPGSRMADQEQIKHLFELYTDTKEIIVIEDVPEAYESAKANKEKYLFCIGSLYLAGMIEEMTGGI